MDQGHKELIDDLKRLLSDAKKFEFHDLKNDKHSAPKLELVGFLLAIAEKAKKGKYDN